MDPKTKEQIELEQMAANELGMRTRVASPYVIVSKCCFHCGGPGPLRPYRAPCMATENPTPQFCGGCIPKWVRSRQQARVDALHSRLTLERYQKDPAEWVRHRMELHWPLWRASVEDLFRRKPLPEPVGRVPSFVWEMPSGGADVLKTIRRGMRFQHGEGWAEGSFDAVKSSRPGRDHW